ncbi:hypothetical protein AWB79_06298 [Caballeronia hypogeia]|uniref:Uncharacterized protein n=1 Tax=Caballeronia hypogeia TaxID=1777140 RepID=A0A158D1R0_9BURK|nr:hypothetical protein [Caballeronia hypogeia]SAK88433.1 hypothetical protein AWB79_06298 [Caballeronia hypogeia]
MKYKTNAILAALVAGTLASVSAASFAQTNSDTPTAADQKAAKEQSKADKKAAVAQAKADKKKTEAQSEANEAAADAKLKNAKKAE